MIRVDSLIINPFRSFVPGAVVKLGETVTLLSGLNGTAKSTLLGMIAQPLGFPIKKGKKSIYTKVYDNVELSDYKTIGDRRFRAEFSEVFRISQKFDKPRNLDYNMHLSGDQIESCSETLSVRSEKRDETIRFVTNSDNRAPGAGNFPHPVIYLGLERLRPLSTLPKKDIIGTEVLPDDEKQIWSDIYRVVMVCNGNEQISPEQVQTGGDFKQSYHSVETTYFDAESASAGQDNLGQIISAILSFFRLEKRLGDKYQGGVLLIDEFDATLHPVAQKLLLHKLIQYSKRFKVQIIATTHSLSILDEALYVCRQDVRCVYFQKRGSAVTIFDDVDYDYVASDLAHIQKKTQLREVEKTSVIFEDCVAANLFKRIICGIFGNYVKTFNTDNQNSATCLSNGVLRNIVQYLVKKKIPDFQRVIYVLDPDSQNLVLPNIKNLLALPGNSFIEKEMNVFLVNLDGNDPVWTALGVSQSFCIAENNNIENDPNLPTEHERRKAYKRWFFEQQGKDSFGASSARLFDEWCKKHPLECRKFCLSFLAALVAVKNPLILAKQDEVKRKIDKKYPAI